MVVGDAYMFYQNAAYEVDAAFDSVRPMLLAVLRMKETPNHPFYHELPANALQQMPPTIGSYPMKNDSKKKPFVAYATVQFYRMTHIYTQMVI